MLSQWLLFPLRDPQGISRRLDAVQHLKEQRALRESVQRALDDVRDMERLLGRVAVGRATPRDLGAIRGSLAQAPVLKATLEKEPSPLGRRWAALDVADDLRDLLVRALAEDAGAGHRPRRRDLSGLLAA